jgi:hypothetical protein
MMFAFVPSGNIDDLGREQQRLHSFLVLSWCVVKNAI